MAVERIVSGTKEFTEQYALHMKRYLFAKNFCKGKAVLDAACGSGYGSATLAEMAKSVLGIDISDEAINFAKANYMLPNLEYRKLNAEQLPKLRKKFDTIVSFETIEHLKNYRKFLDGMIKSMRKDGTLIISTPNFKGKTASDFHNKFHLHEFYFSELFMLLHNYFGEIDIRGERLSEKGKIKTKQSLRHSVDRLRKILLIVLPDFIKPFIKSRLAIKFKPLELEDLEISKENIEQEASYLVAVCRRPRKNPNIVFTASRICNGKGLHLVAKAIVILKKKFPNISWFHAGSLYEEDKSYFETVKGILRKANCLADFHYLDIVPYNAMPMLFNNSTVYILPSYSETFGLAAVEATACGKPVIVSDIAPLNEIVQNNKNGLLFELDNPKDLALKISNILSSKKLQLKLGNAARRTVEKNYSNKVVAKAWIKAYGDAP